MKRGVLSLLFVCTVLLGVPVGIQKDSTSVLGPQLLFSYAQTSPGASTAPAGARTNNTPAAGVDPCESWSAKGIACSITRFATAAIFGLMVSAAGTLMTISGKIFDFVIENLVVNFGYWLQGSELLRVIEQIWGTFRDIGNMVLIGMFIFISIRIILGVGGSSNKQMVINIIIVSLLINFSLFFVKGAIDITNFFSFQFYKNISTLQITDSSGNTTTQLAGVATRFGTSSGVTTIDPNGANPFSRLSTASAESAKISGGIGFFAIVIQGLGLTTMYLGAALVFLYGAGQMIIRAIMLIILMVVSSLAFTTYVLPIPSVRHYFDEWKTSLIQNAIFGPLLIILLWASVMITDALVGVQRANKEDPGSIVALVNYVFVIGFLFAAIKIAQTVASKTDTSLFGLKPRSLIGQGLGYLSGTPFRALAGKYRERNAERAYSAYSAANQGLLQARQTGTPAEIEKAKKALEGASKRLQSTGDFRSENKLAKFLQKQGVNMGTPEKKNIGSYMQEKKAAAKKEVEETVKAMEEAAKNAGAGSDEAKNYDKRRVEAADAQEKLSKEYAALEQAVTSSKVAGDNRTGGEVASAIQNLGGKLQKEQNAQAVLKTQYEAAKASGNETLASKINSSIEQQDARIRSFQAQQNAENAKLKSHRDEIAKREGVRLDRIVEATERAADTTADLRTVEEQRARREKQARAALKANNGRQVFEQMLRRGFTADEARAGATFATKDDKSRKAEAREAQTAADRAKRNSYYERELPKPSSPAPSPASGGGGGKPAADH